IGDLVSETQINRTSPIRTIDIQATRSSRRRFRIQHEAPLVECSMYLDVGENHCCLRSAPSTLTMSSSGVGSTANFAPSLTRTLTFTSPSCSLADRTNERGTNPDFCK